MKKCLITILSLFLCSSLATARINVKLISNHYGESQTTQTWNVYNPAVEAGATSWSTLLFTTDEEIYLTIQGDTATLTLFELDYYGVWQLTDEIDFELRINDPLEIAFTFKNIRSYLIINIE